MNPTIVAVLLLLVPVDSKDVSVSLVDCGEVKGTITTTRHGNIYEFYQIPYAVPPVGERRWTHSSPLTPTHGSCWQGTYDASALRDPPIMCVQKWNEKNWAKGGDNSDKRGQEDCLHLTVRSPDLKPSEPLPVLVWIHGGSLQTGWSEYPGYAPDAEFTGDLNVVTVNINYRLELMGFFSSPEIWNDPENPGNYGNFGIGDAVTALKWIRQNIGEFGGNASSVTLLGESSGATIILGLIGAPQADGLFNKAISLSGPPVWEATYNDAYERRRSFTTDVGCTQRTEAKRRKCLKKMDVESLIKHQDLNRGWGFYDFPYSDGRNGESMDYNVIEPTLIPYAPTDPSKWSRKQHVRLIVSNTGQEVGTNAMYYSTNQLYTWEMAETTLNEKIKILQNQTGLNLSEDLLSEIKKTYNFGQDSNDWWPQIFYDTLTTDVRTTCINNDLVHNLNQNSKYDVYRMYVMSRPDEMRCGIPWSCIHGWDTEALFGYGYYGLQSSSDRHQRKFKDNLRDVVEDFCYDGSILDSDENNVLIMENDDVPNGMTIRDTPPQADECEFWKDYDMLQFGWQN